MITFEEITMDNGEETINLKVSKAQEKYIANNLISIAQCYVERDVAKPFLIRNDKTPIGFILFKVDKSKNFFYIWRFMIDHKYQGRGYGEMALVKGIAYLIEQGAKTIKLSHQDDNYGPGKLYKKLGFKYTGVIDDGEVLMEYSIES